MAEIKLRTPAQEDKVCNINMSKREISKYGIEFCIKGSRNCLRNAAEIKAWRFRKNKRNDYLRALAAESIDRGYVAVGTAAEMREKYGKFFDSRSPDDLQRMIANDPRKYIWSLTCYTCRKDTSMFWYVVY